MSPPPARPKVYHITHIENLEKILACGSVYSDARMIAQGNNTTAIGLSGIKRRRLTLEVTCHRPTKVGEYVPFYFCPRSVMLYLLHRGNHPELSYTGGQPPILHLEADLHRVVEWANGQGRRWAFTRSNAGAAYTTHYRDLGQLDLINWEAVSARDWGASEIKEAKQAEFLVYDTFPWELVEHVGAHNAEVAGRAERAIRAAGHETPVSVRGQWYY